MDSHLFVEAVGTTVGLDLAALDPSARSKVGDAWRDALSSGPGVFGSAELEAPAGPVDEMLAALSTQVTLAALNARRGELWMLHAAGLADTDGRVAVLIGPSGMGKTTSTRILGRRFGYVSDETVGIDASGRVFPYRKPLSLVRPNAAKAQVAPTELGLRPLPARDLSVAALLVLDRRPDGPSVPMLERMDLASALAALVPQSSFLTSMPQPLATIARLIEQVGGVHRLTYREAETLPDLIASFLAAPPPRLASTTSAALVDGAADAMPAIDGVARTPHLDARHLVETEELAILHAAPHDEGRLTVLSGVAPSVWTSANGSPVADIAHHVVAHHGAPPHGEIMPAVTAVVSELVDSGLLVQDTASWAVRDDVAWVDNENSASLLALSRTDATPIVLDGPGAVIWSVLVENGPVSTREVTEMVASAFAEDPEAVAAEVLAFLHRLEQEMLITR